MEQQEMLTRLQDEELDILNMLAAFCRERDICWFLDSGSVLGSLRHQGFIPWDDDIDVGMMRPDYDRFVQLASESLPKGYSIHTFDNTYGFAGMFAKIYKDGTLFSTQETRDAECNQGIFIDVFPYDIIDQDHHGRTRQLKNARLWQSLSYLYHSSSVSVLPDGIKGTVLAFFSKFLHRGLRLLFNRDVLQRHFNKSVVHGAPTEYSGKTYVGILASGDPWVFRCEDLLPVHMGIFCGGTYPIPRNAEKYLSQVYGTWAELPPIEKRKTHCPLYVRFSDGSDWGCPPDGSDD